MSKSDPNTECGSSQADGNNDSTIVSPSAGSILDQDKDSAAPVRQLERRMIRPNKAAEVPPFESKNWLIYSCFVRKDFDTCRRLIAQQLTDTQDMCEYALYIQGLMLRHEGDVQNSMECFQAAAKINPNNPDNVKQIAKSLFLLGKHKTAIEVYSDALEMVRREDAEKSDWEIFHNQGICHSFLGNLSEAKKCLRTAIEQCQQHRSYVELGKIYEKENDMDGAIQVYKEALTLTSEDAELMTTIGLLYLKQDRHQEAFEYLGNALTYSPTNPNAILAVGSVMQKHQDHDVAISKYRIALNSAPECPPLWNNIGMCFYAKKKYTTAVSCLKQGWKFAPLEWRIAYNLGLIHLTLEQYASAAIFLRSAVNRSPHTGDIYILLGIALTHLNEKESAQKSFEQAVNLLPDSLLALLNFSVFLFCHGDQEKALNYKLRCDEIISHTDLKHLDSDLKSMIDILDSNLAHMQTNPVHVTNV